MWAKIRGKPSTNRMLLQRCDHLLPQTKIVWTGVSTSSQYMHLIPSHTEKVSSEGAVLRKRLSKEVSSIPVLRFQIRRLVHDADVDPSYKRCHLSKVCSLVTILYCSPALIYSTSDLSIAYKCKAYNPALHCNLAL